jgi:hypothetical protein
VSQTLQEIDSDLLATMREHTVAYASATPVRRVAVVGNAPLKPSEERRRLIDTAELVFRCNSLALDRPGEPPCVGTRTNVVVTARTARPSPGFFHDYRNRAYFVVDGFQFALAKPPGFPLSWPADLGAWPLPNRAFGLPLTYLLRPAPGEPAVIPTTGTQAVHLAHQLFPEADIMITGFSFLSDRQQETWGYHWGALQRAPVHSSHRLDLEGAYLQDLVDRGEVRFVE